MLLALSFWYASVAVMGFTLWLIGSLPWRRLRMALLPLALGGTVYAGVNFFLYGRLTGFALHREIVSHSVESTAAKWSAFLPSLAQLARTIILPEFFPGLPASAGRLAVVAGIVLLLGGLLALGRAAWVVGRQGPSVLLGEQRGPILGALIWNGSVLLVIFLPLVSGHGAMLGRYLVPVFPCLAIALMPIVAFVFRRLPRWLLTGIVAALAAGIVLAMAGLLSGYLRYHGWGRILNGTLSPTAFCDMGLAPVNNRHIEGGITHPDGIEQRFVMPIDELSGFSIMLCTFLEQHVTAHYRFELFDTVSGDVLVDTPLDAARIRDMGWYTIEFQTRRGLTGRDMTFRLRPSGPVRTPVTVQLCSVDMPGFSLQSAGVARSGTVVFRLLTPIPKTFSTMASRLLDCRPRLHKPPLEQ